MLTTLPIEAPRKVSRLTSPGSARFSSHRKPGACVFLTPFPHNKTHRILDCKKSVAGGQSETESSYLAHPGECCLVLHLCKEKQNYSKLKSQSDDRLTATKKTTTLLSTFLSKNRKIKPQNTLIWNKSLQTLQAYFSWEKNVGASGLFMHHVCEISAPGVSPPWEAFHQPSPSHGPKHRTRAPERRKVHRLQLRGQGL